MYKAFNLPRKITFTSFQSLERAMKFSSEEPHLWKQHALSLLAINSYNHALSVLKEVIRLEPNNPSNCLLAAKLCYEHLNLAIEGKFSIFIQYSTILHNVFYELKIELCLRIMQLKIAEQHYISIFCVMLLKIFLFSLLLRSGSCIT